MAPSWVKSLQCKSRAAIDVVHHHQNHPTKPKTHHHLITNTASCGNTYQTLKDAVVQTTKQNKPSKPSLSTKQPCSTQPVQPTGHVRARTRARTRTTTPHSRSEQDPFFPSLTELPEGHPSRNVVEIIFQTSWSPKAFSGRIEMVFKVQNLNRTLTRFEEYRETVKSRAIFGGVEGGSEDHARCVADGNEVMRFFCLGPTNGGVPYDVCGSAYAFCGGKEAALCTFSGSGCAHERAGGGRGRRAMLVCRVIAGRVWKNFGYDSVLERRVGFDSVSGDTDTLLVFDSRAVLPCFLVIYKL